MALRLTPAISAVISIALLLLSLPPPSSSIQPDFLSVPSSVFSTSVKMAMNQATQTLSLLSHLSTIVSTGTRLSNAINDCTGLLQLSNDELKWALSVANGTGNHASDVKAWLSAALSNHDTCLDGFDGTDGTVKSVVAGSLQKLTATVSKILKMVRPAPSGKFPTWVRRVDRRLLQGTLSEITTDVTVAADGSGDFTSVMDAVLMAPDHNVGRYVIYVKEGAYEENVEIDKKKWNLMMVGDGMGKTVISSNRSFVDGWTTFRSGTFAVSGRGFIARDITFENTAGPEKHQAVALRSSSDLSAFYRCSFHGYQDTLYAHSLRQFYRECHITGTIDFIFGNAAAVFQSCDISARLPLPNQKNVITAQGRQDPNQNTGFSIQFCNISADDDLLQLQNSTATYLGRPWKQYSRTVFMESYISSAIRPEGWLEWEGDFALDTLDYAEYMNLGPGSSLDGRVKWQGFEAISESTRASNYTVAQFIDGDLWLPSTGVRYTSGLDE